MEITVRNVRTNGKRKMRTYTKKAHTVRGASESCVAIGNKKPAGAGWGADDGKSVSG
jgi:hypothetical protein